MARALILTLSSLVLLSAACQTGRYTDDYEYVGNPERPPATSESTTPGRDTPTSADPRAR
jgi:hypothetical protein